LDDTARSTAKFGPYHTSGKETSNLVKGTTDGRTSQPRKQRPTVTTVHSGHGRFHVLRRTLRRPTARNPRRARRSRGFHAQTTVDSYPDHLHQFFNHPQWQKLPPTAKLSATTALSTPHMSRRPSHTPDSDEVKIRDEYRLLSIKRQQRLAIQRRTDARVDFYRQKLGYYPTQDQQSNTANIQKPLGTIDWNTLTSSSTTPAERSSRANATPPTSKQSGNTHVTPSSAAQASNFPPAGPPNCRKRSTASSSTQTPKRSTTSSATQTLQGDIKPFRTFPLCQQNNLYWKIAYEDNTGITWTRFRPNGNQEWLTGSLLTDKYWEFNISKEINDLFPS
jgi:hypothetical protein